jgi:hypothetical protein
VTSEEREVTEQVEQAVDAAIATATVDLEARAGERVRFAPAPLEAVLALSVDESTRVHVLMVLRHRLSASVLAMEPEGVDPDWHDAQAALGLLTQVEGATDGAGRG